MIITLPTQGLAVYFDFTTLSKSLSYVAAILHHRCFGLFLKSCTYILFTLYIMFFSWDISLLYSTYHLLYLYSKPLGTKKLFYFTFIMQTPSIHLTPFTVTNTMMTYSLTTVLQDALH